MDPALPEQGPFTTRVLCRRTLCREHFSLILELPSFPLARPGQFLQILCGSAAIAASQSVVSPGRTAPGEWAPLLRRPFSIGGLQRSNSSVHIELLGRVVGPATAWLDERRQGDAVEIIGPLGRGFSPPDAAQSALLVAGGIGLPPIRWWGEILRNSGVSCTSIYGAQSRDLLPVSLKSEPASSGEPRLCVEELERVSIPTVVTTDDGSCGMRGRVTDALKRILDGGSDPAFLRVYGCGPEPMLRTMAAICTARGVACELALERVMGCGMGTCQSCVVPLIDRARPSGWRYALCCTEGPVFNAVEIRWA